MHNQFENIRTMPGLVAAGLVAADGTLVDWCANSALDPLRLQQAAQRCAQVLAGDRHAESTAQWGVAQLEATSLLFRAMPQGTFLALVQGQVDEATANWFWEQIDAWLRLY
jgi:roadblock/LC7 domain-containing protein